MTQLTESEIANSVRSFKQDLKNAYVIFQHILLAIGLKHRWEERGLGSLRNASFSSLCDSEPGLTTRKIYERNQLWKWVRSLVYLGRSVQCQRLVQPTYVAADMLVHLVGFCLISLLGFSNSLAMCIFRMPEECQLLLQVTCVLKITGLDWRWLKDQLCFQLIFPDSCLPFLSSPSYPSLLSSSPLPSGRHQMQKQ